MAKITKKGLDFFAINVTMLDDPRLQRVARTHGSKAVLLYIALLSLLHQEQGYFLDMRGQNREFVLLALYDKLRGESDLTDHDLEDMLDQLVRVTLFDSALYQQGILTSKHAQEQFYRATDRRKHVRIEPSFWLLSLEEMQDMCTNDCILAYFRQPEPVQQDVNTMQHDVDTLQHDVNKSTQSREQNSTEKKSIEKDRIAQDSTEYHKTENEMIANDRTAEQIIPDHSFAVDSGFDSGFLNEIAVLMNQKIDLNFEREIRDYLRQGMEKALILQACQRTLRKRPSNPCAYLRTVLKNYSTQNHLTLPNTATVTSSAPDNATPAPACAEDAPLSAWEQTWLAEVHAREKLQKLQNEAPADEIPQSIPIFVRDAV